MMLRDRNGYLWRAHQTRQGATRWIAQGPPGYGGNLTKANLVRIYGPLTEVGQ